jgi:hypothetical protein
VSDVTLEQVEGTKPEKRTQNYIVFRQQGEDTFVKIGEYKTGGTTEAKKRAVEENNLSAEVREGKVTVVAVGARLWNPTTPKAQPRPDKLIW